VSLDKADAVFGGGGGGGGGGGRLDFVGEKMALLFWLSSGKLFS